MVYMMKMWIEIEPKLPYALTLHPAFGARSQYDLLNDFNEFMMFGKEAEAEWALIPDVGEANAAVARGDIESYPPVHKVKIKEITSILAQRA